MKTQVGTNRFPMIFKIRSSKERTSKQKWINHAIREKEERRKGEISTFEKVEGKKQKHRIKKERKAHFKRGKLAKKKKQTYKNNQHLKFENEI